jgi:hypothetical protein
VSGDIPSDCPNPTDSPRKIIAEALFLYRSGADQEKRGGKPPWGIERSEWQADAIIERLTAAGYHFARAYQDSDAEAASIFKEQTLRYAEQERDIEIGAGLIARDYEPEVRQILTFEDDVIPLTYPENDT